MILNASICSGKHKFWCFLLCTQKISTLLKHTQLNNCLENKPYLNTRLCICWLKHPRCLLSQNVLCPVFLYLFHAQVLCLYYEHDVFNIQTQMRSLAVSQASKLNTMPASIDIRTFKINVVLPALSIADVVPCRDAFSHAGDENYMWPAITETDWLCCRLCFGLSKPRVVDSEKFWRGCAARVFATIPLAT